MLEAAIEAINNLLVLDRILYLFLGVLMGLALGAIPGLGGLVGLAILLPFTFDMDPFEAASRMDVDEIVRLDEIRAWLELFAEASYQAGGYRRIKNPRIWSLHDLEAVTEGQSD